MKRSLTAGLTCLCLALANGPAAAQPPGAQPGLVIAFLDKNGDGKCDLNEYLTYHAPRFGQFDTNSDGELDLSEFKVSLRGKAKANAVMVFRGANAEGGRGLTQREFLGYQAFVFKTYVDTDKDGFMSAEEWTEIMDRAG